MDIEREIKDLKRRVGDLEGAINVLAGKVGNVHPDVMALRALSELRFGEIDAVMSKCVSRLDTVNAQVWSLRDDLPSLVNTAVKQAIQD